MLTAQLAFFSVAMMRTVYNAHTLSVVRFRSTVLNTAFCLY